MAQLDDLYSALRNADAAGDHEGAQKLADYIKSQSGSPAPVEEHGVLATLAQGLSHGVGQGMYGAQRLVGKGIQAIGSAVDDGQPGAIHQLGNSLVQDAAERSGAEDAKLSPYQAQHPIASEIGNVAGNIISTAPVGGVLGLGLRGVGAAGAAAAEAAGVAPTAITAASDLAMPVVRAVESSGMTTGAPVGAGARAVAQNLITRAAGGAVTGGASGELIDPDHVARHAVFGAIAPAAFSGMGALTNKAGSVISGPPVSASMRQAAQDAIDAGYKLPPSLVKPTLFNRGLEGYAGKLSTAQNLSAANQGITNAAVAKDLGLPADTHITTDVLDDIRKTAGQAYEALGKSGRVTPIVPTQGYHDALDKAALPAQTAQLGFPNGKPSAAIDLIDSLRSPVFSADAAIAKIRQLRDIAGSSYGPGSDAELGRAAKAGSKALEDAIETHLGNTGETKLLDDYRDARKLIAQTYTVQKALNPATGTVNAKTLAGQLDRGKPLEGGMRQAAEFAQAFPTAAKTPEMMGSLPGVSPLDFGAAQLAAVAHPGMLATIIGRPLARAIALSGPVQRNLVTPTRQFNVPAVPNWMTQLGYQAAPDTQNR